MQNEEPNPNLKQKQLRNKIGFNADLLRMLVCPVSKGALIYDEQAQELISKSAKLAYTIRNGIPVLLKEEAREL
jgi:uncharacterized protein YbaR (Trm112 family)